MKYIHAVYLLCIVVFSLVNAKAQCTGGCPAGAITTMPSGSATIAAGTTYCISTTTDLSNNTYIINGTVVIQAGTVTLKNITINKTGVILVKLGARLILSGALTGENVAPASTKDNLVVCNGGFLNITGSFSQGEINIAVNDFGVMQVSGTWTSGFTDPTVKIGNGSLIELCAAFNLNKDGFFIETSTGVSYLVAHASMRQSVVNGWLSSLQNASKIKWTSDAPAAFISHPAAYTCNGCGNDNLAPPGTNSTCGSAANAQNSIVLPVTITNFYGKAVGEQFQITGVVDNAYTITDAQLEYSTDGEQFTPAPYKAVITKAAITTTCNFTLPLQESGKFYRLRISGDEFIRYSTVLLPSGNSTNSKLLLYPNPVHNAMFVQLPKNHRYSDLNIFNQSGQLVYHKSITALSGITRCDLPANFAAGVYTVRFTGAQTPLVMQLVKD